VTIEAGRRLPRCQSIGCPELAARSVRIELPWFGAGPATGSVAPVSVGLCPRCAREVASRAQRLLDAHGTFAQAVAVIEGAAEARRRIDELRGRLARSEYELGVFERAHLRLLQANDSEVVDVRDVRLGLGLPV
jgi:hypothetical protein